MAKMTISDVDRLRNVHLSNPFDTPAIECAKGKEAVVEMLGADAADTYPLVKGGEGEPDRLFIFGAIVTEMERKLFEEFYPDDVSASQISRLLSDYNGTDLELMINCPGGVVREGVAIYEALSSLREKGVNVTAFIAGESASAATVVQYSADKVEAAQMARLFYHPPNISAMFGADATLCRLVADELDSLEGQLLELYKNRRGVDMKAALNAESKNGRGTWYTAKAALDEGLIDSVRSDESAKEGEKEDPKTSILAKLEGISHTIMVGDAGAKAPAEPSKEDVPAPVDDSREAMERSLARIL